MHPVCLQVHPLGRRARSPPPAREREGKSGPAFPPSAFQPPLHSASPVQKRPLPEATAAETGEVLGPKGRSGLRLPLSPPRPRCGPHLRPGNPTAWKRPSVNGPLGTPGTKGRGRARSLWAGLRRKEGAAQRRGSLHGLPATSAGARLRQRACPPRRRQTSQRAWERRRPPLTKRKDGRQAQGAGQGSASRPHCAPASGRAGAGAPLQPRPLRSGLPLAA